jgi:outer membrane protein assembly complex protein YaeT
MKCRRHSKFVFGVCLLFLAGGLFAQTNLKVEGMGLLQDRSLKNRLAFLQDLEADQPVEIDAALLEDSAFLLIEQLKRDGYLQPTVEAVLTESGGTRRVRWTSPYAIQMDADAVAEEVVFVIDSGLLAYYDEVEINGAPAIGAEALQRYFVPGGVLLQTRRAKVFTWENFDRRIGRVVESLEALGYGDAQVLQREASVDDQTGAVDVRLEFEQGPRHYVGSLTHLIRKDGQEIEKTIEVDADTLRTRAWEQDQRSTYRNDAFEAGYPDAEVVLQREPAAGPEGGEARTFDYQVIADWGEPATLGEVRFQGDEATRRKTLRRRLNLEKGEPLNRLEVDEARRRLMGLGIYKQVAVKFEPDSGAERDVVYSLEPGLRQELRLLGGWGSYEQARVGFNWEHRNPFGRAHRYEVDAKQSLKSTRGGVRYSIPQIFGSDVSLYSNAEYNKREEITFDRSNRGVSFGAAYAAVAGLRLSAEYGFFREEADREDGSSFESEENATVASLGLRVSYDQRDNFLAPSSGWSVYSELKIANTWLGGSVDFQKLELGGSYHFPLTESTLMHLGLRGGAIYTAGEREQNIPFNERYFIGGENSVRGYREGQASPLDSDGDQLGAETYALFNLELEQRVYSKFSTILFLDSVLHARDGFGGETELLHSMGLGLRYQTAIGPVRVEYGHNLNPREQDPDGTFHLSIGFPF